MIIVDPQSDDFIYEPIMFRLFKRRPLKKYGYLSDVSKRCFFSYRTSSLPEKINNILPQFLLYLFVKFEKFFWLKINKLIINEVLLIKPEDVFFLFGYKKIETLSYLVKKFPENSFYVHLSHYHTFHKKLNNLLLKCDNIKLCFDFDVSNLNYFKRSFTNYQNKITVIPFEVKNRFFERINNTGTREKINIGIVGTYHELPLSNKLINIYTFDKKHKTLHPIRQAISKHDFEDCDWIDNRLSLYKKKSNFNFFGFSNQKKYFSFDIVEFYDKLDYLICPSEATGALGIGVLEAMARGVGVIISSDDLRCLNLNPTSEGIIVYNSLESLMKIILNPTNQRKKLFNNNIKIANQYKSIELIINAKNKFNIK